MIGLSNVAYDDQSMFFKDDIKLSVPFGVDLERGFCDNLQFAMEGAEDDPTGTGQVMIGDVKSLEGAVDGPFDLIVKLPRYANRMSSIRKLRPDIYWLRFLDNGPDAGELNWSAIGGT